MRKPSPVPSESDIRQILNVALATVIAVVTKMGLDAYTLRSLGVILSQVKPGQEQSRDDIEAIVNAAAKEQHEAIKVHLLRASIDAASTIPRMS